MSELRGPDHTGNTMENFTKEFLNNKQLNLEEIGAGKTALESKPRSLRVGLTTRCNINCIMCDFNKGKWDLPLSVVKEIEGLMPYLRHIQWYGGEVFLSPYFERLFEKAAAYGHIAQRIDTNGLMLDRRWAKKITATNTGLDLSIDGITEKTYEYIRHGGKFRELTKNLSMLKSLRERKFGRNKLPAGMISMSFIVMKANYLELEGLVDFALKYGVSTIIINRLSLLEGKLAAYHLENIENSPEIIAYVNKTIPKITKLAQKHKIRVINSIPGVPRTGTDYKASAKKARGGLFCYLPWNQLCINPSGYITPHCFCPTSLAHIDKSGLSAVWNNKVMREYRKKLLNGEYSGFCSEACVAGKVWNLGIDW